MAASEREKNLTEEQFEQLFSEYYEYLCRKTLALLHDPETTKDIVQDVFLRIWRQRALIDPGTDIKAYLGRSCINQALNYLRTHKRTRRRETLYVARFQNDHIEADAESQLELGELADKITSGILALSPARREAFLLSRYAHMSYSEIAQKMGISISTVEKHMGKALQSLKVILNRE